MQNSTLKHPKDAQRRFFISLANHVRREFIYPSECESHRQDTRIGTHVYLHKTFQTQQGSRTGPGWDLLKLERTDHDWQPWRLHGEALLPVRQTWEQRGRSYAVLVSAQLLVPSLARSPLFHATFFDNETGKHILRIPNMFLMISL